MITVHNINEYTLQQVYDQIAVHLLTQAKRSISTAGRLNIRYDVYHATDGSKCAIGSLIPTPDYSHKLESLHFSDMLLSFGVVMSDDLERMLEMLRVLHDDYSPSEWPLCLPDIAKKMQLSSEVVSCFT